jgi:hypothetical protein
VTTFGEGAAKRARAATQVVDTAWTQAGQGEIEVGILRPRVSDVLKLCDLSVLIVHPIVAQAVKASHSRFYSC